MYKFTVYSSPYQGDPGSKANKKANIGLLTAAEILGAVLRVYNRKTASGLGELPRDFKNSSKLTYSASNEQGRGTTLLLKNCDIKHIFLGFLDRKNMYDHVVGERGTP